MKSTDCLLILTFILFFSCKKKGNEVIEDGFKITVSIKNVKDHIPVYLKKQENRFLHTFDSTVVKNEKFEFFGKTDGPEVYGIYFEDLKGSIGVFMENDTIYIEAYKDSLAKSKITGSKIHNDYLDFIKQSNRIVSKMNHLFPIFQKARAENDADKLEEINAQMRAINEENTRFALQYAKQHPDSYIGALALQSVLTVPTIDKDTIVKIYNNFSDYVKKGDFAIEIAQYLNSDQSLDSIINEK